MEEILRVLFFILSFSCSCHADFGFVDNNPPVFNDGQSAPEPPSHPERSTRLLHAILRRTRRQTECDSKWTDLDPNHTMCQEDVGTEVVLSQTTKDALLEQHNNLRGQVSPLAANMPKLVWDDELALVAAKWARQCVVGHDPSRARRVPSLPGIHVGQNGAFGYGTFEGGVQAWFDEYVDFEYGTGAKTPGAVIGHYTQMVAARTHRIGCGQADCTGHPYTRYYICNYAVGQYSSDTVTPYRNDTASCTDCPEHCDSTGTLCDCGGKLCLNGGAMDITTCSCTCPDIYSGPMCETLNCPENDAWYCGSQWPPSYCNIYSNVPHVCPYMCGLCSNETTTQAPSTTHVCGTP